MTSSGDHDGVSLLAATTIALTYGAAPLYSAFCSATGFNGAMFAQRSEKPAADRAGPAG